MNYELESARKARTDHMNLLVYKEIGRESDLGMAETIISRLKIKEEERS